MLNVTICKKINFQEVIDTEDGGKNETDKERWKRQADL